jgi:hypothetical protein
MMENYIQANGIWKQAGLAIAISNKDVKPKLVRRHKEGHYILVKETIHKEDVTIINIYSSNVAPPIS